MSSIQSEDSDRQVQEGKRAASFTLSPEHHRWATWWRAFKFPKRRQDRETYHTVLRDEALGFVALLTHYPFIVSIGMMFWRRLNILHDNNNFFTIFCAGEEPVDLTQFSSRKKLRIPERLGYFKKSHVVARKPLEVVNQATAGNNVDYLRFLLSMKLYRALIDKFRKLKRLRQPFTDIPIHRAAICGHAGSMRVLLEHHFPPDLVDHKERAALDQAVHWGHTEVVKILLHAEANVNLGTGTGDHGHWLLHRTRDCTPELVRILVDAGAEVNCVNAAGSTPLHIACSCWGSEETVRILLAAGAKVNVKDRSQETPLHCAAESQRPGVVKLLLEAGAEVNVTRDDGETPLHCACREEGSEELVPLLIRGGANVSTKNTQLGRQALHLAAFSGASPVVIRALLAAGSCASPRDQRGITPLHLAACWGYLDLAEILVAAGAQAYALDVSQCTPLHYAIKWGSTFAENATYYPLPSPEGGASLPESSGEPPPLLSPRTANCVPPPSTGSPLQGKRRGPSVWGSAMPRPPSSNSSPTVSHGSLLGLALVRLLVSAGGPDVVSFSSKPSSPLTTTSTSSMTAFPPSPSSTVPSQHRTQLDRPALKIELL